MKKLIGAIALSFVATASGAGVVFDKNDLPEIVEASRMNAARFERDYKGETFAARMPFDRLERTIIRQDFVASFGQGSLLPDVECKVFDQRTINRLIDEENGKVLFVRGRIVDTFAGVLKLKDCEIR